MRDLLVTWSKKDRTLESYIVAIEEAERDNKVINFRVPTKPKEMCERCYVVYDGQIVGWSPILEYAECGEREVQDVMNRGYWPAGIYVVREPIFEEIKPISRRGFQGYRYIDRTDLCDHEMLDWEERCDHCDFEQEEAPWKAAEEAYNADREEDVRRLSGNIMDSEVH